MKKNYDKDKDFKPMMGIQRTDNADYNCVCNSSIL